MRPRPRVDDDAVCAVVVRRLYPFDERAFDVRLKKRNVHSEFVRQSGYFFVDALKRFGPVLFGIALAEHVEVDAVHDQNACHLLVSFQDVVWGKAEGPVRRRAPARPA